MFLALVLVALTLAASQQPVAALSFWDSQFSTSEFAQIRYKDMFTVSVFKHLTKNSSFYITPLVLLDHRSGSLRYNFLTEFHELRFKVLMWDPELQDSVRNYLTTTKGIAHPEVKLLPMEKVRFDWRSRSRPIKKSILMEGEFIAMHHLPRYLTLTFACKDRSKCDALNRQVQQHPEAMDSLVMDCFMTTQKSATKIITINTENLAQTKTFAKLLTLPADGNYRYMRAEDFNSLAQETFSNVRAATIRSSEYVDKHDELNIMKLIQDSVKQDEIYSSSLIQSQWASVFWDPAFARPDKVTHEASKTFRKNASTGRLDVNKEYLRSSEAAQKLFNKDKYGVGISAKKSTGVEEVEGNLSLDFDFERGDDKSSKSINKTSYSTSELNEMLQEENLNVEWDGEKFIVKPLRLIRINQQTLRARRELVSHNMQLTIYQQTLTLKVIVKATHNQTWLLSESSTGGSFPTQFSYCLLSNGGSCPPGFKRSAGFMKGVNLDTTSSGMIRSAKLGDSEIRCHSPHNSNNCAFKGWEPYKGELHLHVCCR